MQLQRPLEIRDPRHNQIDILRLHSQRCPVELKSPPLVFRRPVSNSDDHLIRSFENRSHQMRIVCFDRASFIPVLHHFPPVEIEGVFSEIVIGRGRLRMISPLLFPIINRNGLRTTGAPSFNNDWFEGPKKLQNDSGSPFALIWRDLPRILIRFPVNPTGINPFVISSSIPIVEVSQLSLDSLFPWL